MSKQRYIHQEKLGAGAMGEVWLAEDTLLDRPVALKYLSASDLAIHKEFFLAEARALARLQHPHITLIYDAVFDEERHTFYLVMEYVAGESLDKLINRWSKPLPLELILSFTLEILDALQYAHDRDVVHRDIKPENVIIHQESVKLTDFGVAGLISAMQEGSSLMVGTPGYMAPEQVRGRPVDGRADLYALGTMLFEMVTGRLPFEYCQTRSEILLAHLNDTPPSPGQFVDDLPVALEHLLMRLLAKDPADRPPTAETKQIIKSLLARHKASQLHLNLVDPEASPLVGRADELARLETAWDQMLETQEPGLVVLRGEPGIGKTRLAVEFIGHLIDRGFTALVGRGDQFHVPYNPFSQILATIINRNLVSSVPQAQLDQLLVQIPDLSRLLQLPPPPPDSDLHDVGQAHWQFYATLLSIFTELEPTVIFLENVSTLDEASIELVRFLLQRQQLPLLFIAACHPTDQAWFASLPTDIIELPALPPPAVADFVEQWIGAAVPKAAVDLIQERSRGNPLKIEMTANQLLEEGALYRDENDQLQYKRPESQEGFSSEILTDSIISLFNRKLSALSEESYRGLTLAALLDEGVEFDFDLWLATLGGESAREQANRILAEARQKRIIRQIDESRYAFRPADIGQSLVAQLTPEQRQKEHKKIADILREKDISSILVGYHYSQAGYSDKAAILLKAAGDKALERLAIEVAIGYYNRSAAISPSLAIYKTLGELYRHTGRWQASLKNYHQALSLAETADEEANLLNSLAFNLWLHDQYKEAYQQANKVLKLPQAPATERAIAQSHLGMISWLVGRLEEAEQWCLQAVEALQDTPDEANLAAAYNRLGLVYFSLGRLDRAEEVIQASLVLRQKLKDIWGQAYCLVNLTKVSLEQGRFAKVTEQLEAAQQLFEKISSQDGLMVVYTLQGRAMLYQDRPREALPWLTQALRLGGRIGKQAAYGLSDIYLLIAGAYLQLNRLDRAEAATQDALRIVEAAGNREYVAMAQATLGRIYAAQNNLSAAEAAYRQALSLFEEIGAGVGLIRVRLDYAQFLADKGETDSAQSLARQAKIEAEQLGLHLP